MHARALSLACERAVARALRLLARDGRDDDKATPGGAAARKRARRAARARRKRESLEEDLVGRARLFSAHGVPGGAARSASNMSAWSRALGRGGGGGGVPSWQRGDGVAGLAATSVVRRGSRAGWKGKTKTAGRG